MKTSLFSKFFLITFFLHFSFIAFAQRPKIGLALSGGGAKGLVHIGILKAVDSAGLKVDYIAGTSMGSIVGAMYAVGYSADTIETLARKLDWTQLLSNKPTIETTPIENKSEYGKYLVSFPIENWAIKPRGGVIESQELWLKFHEIFQPVYGITDFHKFNIPFTCVATDLQTGKPVVLTKGDLIQSIRASMALPSIFTPVKYKDTKLIDGGIVENFPVSEVVNMGAKYVIGVSVTDGLEKISKLETPLDVLQQVAFFKDADNFEKQKKRTNLYIQPDLSKYTGGSFADSDSIIDIGIREGKKYYPIFKRIADSLNAKVDTTLLKNRLIKKDSITIEEVEVVGLKNISEKYFLGRLNLSDKNKRFTVQDLNKAVRYMHTTDYYERLNYELEPISEEGNKVKMRLTVTENPMTFLRVGVHYAIYSKIAIITNLTKNNFITPTTSASLKLNISENFRALAQTHSYLNRYNTSALKFTGYYERIKRPRYKNYQIVETYNNVFSQIGADYYKYFSNKLYLTGGLGYTVESYDESISIFNNANAGIISYLTSRAGIGYHSLNKSVFPTKGLKVEVQGSYISNQRANDAYPTQIYQYLNATDSTATSLKGYSRLLAKVESYLPLTSRATLINKFQFGANFNFDRLYGNMFFIGGVIDYNRNQITFSGLRDATLPSSSVAVGDVGLQYDLTKSILMVAQVSAGVKNFISAGHDNNKRNQFLSGGALSIGYNSTILPVYLTVMYSPQSNKVAGNLNVGFHF